MLGQEIDQFVSDNASHCEWCRKQARQIGNKWTDLNQATRRASAGRAGTASIIVVREAKEALKKQRHEAFLHIQAH